MHPARRQPACVIWWAGRHHVLSVMQFCPSVAPGHSKALECLEGVRNEADFSPECRDLLDQGIEQRSRDFELDPAMRRACKDDIRRTCVPRPPARHNVFLSTVLAHSFPPSTLLLRAPCARPDSMG